MRFPLRTLLHCVPLGLVFASPLAAQWIEPAHVLQEFKGDVEGGQFGYSLSNLGDCNGDGVADFAVSSALHSAGGSAAGRVSVFSGATGELLFQHDGQAGDQLGLSIGGGGDVNQDGHGDVVVGVPQRHTGPGHVLVLSGLDGSILLSVQGENQNDRFGAAVEFIGDFNGDGADDLVVGVPGYNTDKPGAPGEKLRDGGRVIIFSGKNGEELSVVDGELYRGRLGSAVDGVFNAWVRLLVIGEPGAGRGAKGRVIVLRGTDLEPAFTIEGDESTSGLGNDFVSIVGDVNGDGVADVYASDPRSSLRGDRAGIVLIHSGATGDRLLTLTGENALDGFGSGDGRVGDVDGDGRDDLLIGSWLSRDGAEKGGKVMLFSGADGSVLRRWTGDRPSASLGFDAVGMGDVNGDGQLDFLISAALSDDGGVDAGGAYLVSGDVCEPGEHTSTAPVDLPTMEVANGLFKRGEFREAAASYRRIAEARPEEMRAWFLLGLSHHYLGQYEEALSAHLRAARFPESAVNATYNAACAQALLGNSDQAFVLLRKAMDGGFDDLRHIEGDRDLVSLQSDPRWEDIVPSPDRIAAFLEPGVVVLHELVGQDDGSHFGWSVKVPGDCDGDDVDDLLVSAPFFEQEGQLVGRVDLFSGATGGVLNTWIGTSGCSFGRSLTTLGDVDGDEVPDFAVGASGLRGGIGRVHVFSGASGDTLFVSEGETVGGQFGRAIAGIGDFDGDGHGDIAIGKRADGAEDQDNGSVQILSGATGKVLADLPGRTRAERFGSAVAGSFGGSERVLLVGARDGGPGKRGRVYVFRDGIDEPDFILESDEGGVDLGRIHVSLISDLNGDQLSEILVGDWRHGSPMARTGQLRVVSGADGSQIFQINGSSPGEGYGIGACEGGDFDGDGVRDILTGAWLNQAGAADGGKVYAISGSDGRQLASWTSTLRLGRFGSAVTGIGDVNGDGVPDLVVGAPAGNRISGRPGRVFIISGATSDTAVALDYEGR
ncbi:MAG: hypothetical protein ACI9K5_000134 [Gammaproteobacteria bacterium]